MAIEEGNQDNRWQSESDTTSNASDVLIE